ncbi:MAG: nuclear transport factor 2 family protein [Clostridia bacterium]|nr:nuclear transport factor 2 family protein [Clostridia bacterium]
MKKFTKILALVLSVLMVVSCFAACTKEEKVTDEPSTVVKEPEDVKNPVEPVEKPLKQEEPEEPKKAAKDDAAEVEEVAEDFFKTFQSGDLEALSEFFADESGAYDELMSSFDMGDIEDMTAGAEELGLSENEVADMFGKMLGTLFGELDYEIKDVDVDGDEAEVEFEMSIPDYEAVDESALDMDSIMMEVLEDSGYTMEKLSKMTEDDLMELMPEIMGTAFEELTDVMVDAAKDAGLKTKKGTFTFENIDGEWLITGAK